MVYAYVRRRKEKINPFVFSLYAVQKTKFINSQPSGLKQIPNRRLTLRSLIPTVDR
jgi:hypothetical protein